MEKDGKLLWKRRASHESHLANFGNAGRGGHGGGAFRSRGHSCRWAGLTTGPKLRGSNWTRRQRRGRGVVWRTCLEIVHHRRNTRAQIWRAGCYAFYATAAVVWRFTSRRVNLTRVGFPEALAGTTASPLACLKPHAVAFVWEIVNRSSTTQYTRRGSRKSHSNKNS